MNTDHSDPQYRGFLAGEGFGSSSCHLEPHPTDNVSLVDMTTLTHTCTPWTLVAARSTEYCASRVLGILLNHWKLHKSYDVLTNHPSFGKYASLEGWGNTHTHKHTYTHTYRQTVCHTAQVVFW